MTDVDLDGLTALRKPFPPDAIGTLPGRGGGPALSYVGHADLTARLLDVDPTWTWEPMAVDERGLPAFDKDGNLWIRLTVCGVTRIGVGDSGNGKGAKEAIGDALRNAGMRFGAALDLWAKGDRDRFHVEHAEWRTKTLAMISAMDDEKKVGLRTWIGQEGYGLDPSGWDEDTCKAIRHRIHVVTGS